MLKTGKEKPKKAFQNSKPSFSPVQFLLHQLTMSQLTLVLFLLQIFFSVERSRLSFNQNVQQTDEAV